MGVPGGRAECLTPSAADQDADRSKVDLRVWGLKDLGFTVERI